MIKDWVIQKLGLFDENLYPAYCEDIDYILRVIRYNWNHEDQIKKSFLTTPYYHGYSLSTDHNYYEVGGSQTKKYDQELAAKIDFAHHCNFEYMTKKWGSRWRNLGPCNTPLDIDNMPISYTSYDLEFLRKKYLGF